MMGDRRPRWAEFVSTLVIAVGVLAAVAPLGRVLDGEEWFVAVAAVVVPVLVIGAVARLTRWPGAALGAEFVTWIVAVTATQLRTDAVAGIIPGPETIAAAVVRARESIAEVVTGTSPLPVSAGVSLLVAAAAGLVALLVDQIAVSARVPFMAAPVLVSIALLPSIAVEDGFDAAAILTIAAVVLALCAIESGTRRESVRPARGRGPRAVVTAASAVVILVATLAITPVVPHPAPLFDLGRGATGTSISTSLDLGNDLRLPNDVEVFRVRTDAPGYLRALTITNLGPDGWRADDATETVPLSEIPPVTDAPGVERTDIAVNVEVTGLSSTRLPVPYPAVSLSGLAGDTWRLAPADRTVTGAATSNGLEYRTIASVPHPTADRLRRATAGGAADPRTSEVPAGLPDIIVDRARSVTAGADTDYDRLTALQDWFRGDDFRYSLTAPSRLGYDDGGLAATAQFLELREGYCVHFASAFTLMARSLGMPTRIVVGYLPGTPLANAGGSAAVYSVTNRELHSWPEVHFEGVGWVGFEPTHGIGEPAELTPLAETTTPPSASPAATPGATFSAPPLPAPPASATPSATPAVPGTASERGPTPPLIPLGLAVLLLVAVAFPAILRGGRDVRASSRARTGDAGAAWGIVRRRAIDLGIPVAVSDSPRAIGERLVARGAPAVAVGRLVTAVETAAYGPPGSRAPSEGLIDDVRTIRAALTAATRPLRRIRATILPMSSFRPPSEGRDRTR